MSPKKIRPPKPPAPRPESALCNALLLAAFYGLFLAHKINLVTADLGRHLKNGELFFQTLSPLAVNFYSYTEPYFSCINHHWGTGAIFFLIWKLAGFAGLQLFFIGISLTAFLIFHGLACRRASVGLSTMTALAIMPLLAERTEIRPEALSYLFCALFLWILVDFKEGRGSPHRLWVLPALEVLWVNCHIYFFLGPVLIALFLIEELFRAPRRPHVKALAKVLLACAAATLLNPFGVAGCLAPLSIFKNYGYRLVENQPVWFIEKLISNPNFLIFKIVFALLLLSFLLAWWKTRRPPAVVNAALSLMVSAMAWLAIRNFAVFGLFALPLFSENIKAAFPAFIDKHSTGLRRASLSALLIVILLAWQGKLLRVFPYWREPGLGLEAGNSLPAEFIKREGIRGPLFNDYDIGGYLIYHLFPQEPVFVDNRPEAYSESFFQDTYIPMQQSEPLWRRQDNRYGFNAIVFNRHDATPWGQNFLIQRVQDPRWAVVFVDAYTIIFVKRVPANASVIARYEIPKSRFSISRPKAAG